MAEITTNYSKTPTVESFVLVLTVEEAQRLAALMGCSRGGTYSIYSPLADALSAADCDWHRKFTVEHGEQRYEVVSR